mmetsp:Transcript_16963/g.48368  ORF Transcript_16963/g.48368 Transcript_16963/m.48368 type:complete len:231 (+) Transcript_16963:365-1057(+)
MGDDFIISLIMVGFCFIAPTISCTASSSRASIIFDAASASGGFPAAMSLASCSMSPFAAIFFAAFWSLACWSGDICETMRICSSSASGDMPASCCWAILIISGLAAMASIWSALAFIASSDRLAMAGFILRMVSGSMFRIAAAWAFSCSGSAWLMASMPLRIVVASGKATGSSVVSSFVRFVTLRASVLDSESSNSTLTLSPWGPTTVPCLPLCSAAPFSECNSTLSPFL